MLTVVHVDAPDSVQDVSLFAPCFYWSHRLMWSGGVGVTKEQKHFRDLVVMATVV